MTFTISKTFAFSASHVLNGLPEGHPCGRLHGHNYVVDVELQGLPDDRGFVLDYGELALFGRWLDDTVDHQHLNERCHANPTAENLAQWFHAELQRMLGRLSGYDERWWVAAVRVHETPKTCAEYRVP